MAAKNGCSEAAQLLLAHGASVEARANVISFGHHFIYLLIWSLYSKSAYV
jgi:ankyrin repeat protein